MGLGYGHRMTAEDDGPRRFDVRLSSRRPSSELSENASGHCGLLFLAPRTHRKETGEGFYRWDGDSVEPKVIRFTSGKPSTTGQRGQ
jgi:hypothetical protein